MAVVGPGTIQDKPVDRSASLDDATEFEYITVLNPLTDDFAVRVAQDVPVNMPVTLRAKTGATQDSRDLVRNYGLDLSNADFRARRTIFNDVIIQAGQTKNFRGDQAQVAVRQLVNEILQREGKTRMSMDPEVRREVEERIIIHRGSVEDFMERQLQSPRNQINDAIAKSNEVEHEFPGLQGEQGSQETAPVFTEGSGTLQADHLDAPKRGRGRPKASE